MFQVYEAFIFFIDNPRSKFLDCLKSIPASIPVPLLFKLPSNGRFWKNTLILIPKLILSETLFEKPTKIPYSLVEKEPVGAPEASLPSILFTPAFIIPMPIPAVGWSGVEKTQKLNIYLKTINDLKLNQID